MPHYIAGGIGPGLEEGPSEMVVRMWNIDVVMRRETLRVPMISMFVPIATINAAGLRQPIDEDTRLKRVGDPHPMWEVIESQGEEHA